MRVAIGVDIGGSHIVCCGVDLHTHALIEDTRFERKLDRKGSKEAVFRSWAAPLNQSLEALSRTPVAGIGFAMPGAFDYKKGIALFAGNDKYENLHRVDVGREFAPYVKLEYPVLRFINDATAFGIGTAYHAAQGTPERLLAITLGTGFGSTCNAGGLPVTRGERVPPHGSLWHLPFRNGIADDYFSTRWFLTTYRAETGQSVAGVKELAERAETDEAARQLFERFGANLAEFLDPWLTRFGAERLVIGGNISRAWTRMEPAFWQALDASCTDLQLQTSALMEEAAMVGGAKLLDDTFWKQVKEDLPER